MTDKNITRVIGVMRRTLKGLPSPSVTMVGRRWQDPFLVLVSCILSLRTKDETTLPAAERLFSLARAPRDMARLSVAQVEKAIYPVGFYRTKARNILRICRDILDKFDGRVPGDLETLLTFKGVGRKTANLVMTEGFGKPAICVDTHVHRISNRMGYVSTFSPEETEAALRKKLPKRFWIEYNALLVMWGQNICRPVSPWCSRCAIAACCARRGVTRSR